MARRTEVSTVWIAKYARTSVALVAMMTVWATGNAQHGSTMAHLADLVDPRIGLLGNGEGATVMGPTLPHGSIHPSPDTVEGGQAGYRVGKPIRGFSQLHASGTGYGRYGNIMVSPQVGLEIAPEGHDSEKTDEVPTPYSYKVRLARYNIVTEVSPTHHAAIYRFTFPKGEQSYLTLDLSRQIPGQLGTKPGEGKVDASTITIDPKDGSFSGSSRYAGGFGGGNYTVYFYGVMQARSTASGTWLNDASHEGKLQEQWSNAGDRVGGWWKFSTREQQPVLMKIAVSFRSVDRAKLYLDREIGGWNYEGVRDAARKAWDEALGRVEITTTDPVQRTVFYTAMYHAQIMPRDRTGDFERFGEDVPMWDDFYATWDVWRTAYPLMTFLQPDMVRGTIRSFEERLKVDGQVRDTMTAGFGGRGKYPGYGNGGQGSTQGDQGGNDIDNIIADAYVKGLRGVDWNEAYKVLKFDADQERKGNFAEGVEDYRRMGWIRPGIMSVSNTLEYAYNDFCLAEVATGLGKTDDARTYSERAKKWEYLFNPNVESDGYRGFLLPRNVDGSWVAFDPKQYGGSWKNYYYEANSWTYSFFVPHQAGRLVELMGGPKTFAERLEHANANNLIDLWNEPGFLAPTLFHYAGRPDMSSRWMRRFAERYTLKGYPGDDDSGAMSAYYVWASMGMFPNAGQDLYFLNAPLVAGMKVKRPEDGVLTVQRKGSGDFIASVTLNGRKLDRAWVRHQDIFGNTTLVFTMSTTPTDWGTGNPPPSGQALLDALRGQGK